MRRANPKGATWVLTFTGVALALTTAGALSLLAFTEAARIPVVASLGRWPARHVGREVPVPWWLGLLAAVCITAIAADVVRQVHRYGRAVAPAVRLQLATTAEVISIDDASAYAYACRPWPFRPGVIVVSEGLAHGLDEDEQAAILAHERSHLEHYHGVFQLVALMLAAINPLLRPLRREIDFSLERWADEDAAATVGRTSTVIALGVSAVRQDLRTPPVARYGLEHANSRVPDRMRALLDDKRKRGRALLTMLAATTAGAAVATLLAAHNTEHLFEVLRK